MPLTIATKERDKFLQVGRHVIVFIVIDWTLALGALLLLVRLKVESENWRAGKFRGKGVKKLYLALRRGRRCVFQGLRGHVHERIAHQIFERRLQPARRHWLSRTLPQHGRLGRIAAKRRVSQTMQLQYAYCRRQRDTAGPNRKGKKNGGKKKKKGEKEEKSARWRGQI